MMGNKTSSSLGGGGGCFHVNLVSERSFPKSEATATGWQIVVRICIFLCRSLDMGAMMLLVTWGWHAATVTEAQFSNQEQCSYIWRIGHFQDLWLSGKGSTEKGSGLVLGSFEWMWHLDSSPKEHFPLQKQSSWFLADIITSFFWGLGLQIRGMEPLEFHNEHGGCTGRLRPKRAIPCVRAMHLI